MGARRSRAAQLAGLTSVPASGRTVHPLEEADEYKTLLDNALSCPIDQIAAKVGKSKAYVDQRLSRTRSHLKSVRSWQLTCFPSPTRSSWPPQPRDAARSVGAVLRPLAGGAKYSREWLEPIGRLVEWLMEYARLDPRSEQTKVLLPELASQVEKQNRRTPPPFLPSRRCISTPIGVNRSPFPRVAGISPTASTSASTRDLRSSSSASTRGASFKFASRRRSARALAAADWHECQCRTSRRGAQAGRGGAPPARTRAPSCDLRGAYPTQHPEGARRRDPQRRAFKGDVFLEARLNLLRAGSSAR